MVTRHGGDAAPAPTPTAPVVKRKRRASCLGEQERRERKRAIDREAQRSLREKTKTHIAELERTIQILKDQDRNGATSSLLTEIDSLRAENERLRDVIDSVKSVVGGEIFPKNTGQNANVQHASPPTRSPNSDSPGPTAQGQRQITSKSRENSISNDNIQHSKTPHPTHNHIINTEQTNPHFASVHYNNHSTSNPPTQVDIDGMSVISRSLVHSRPQSHTSPPLPLSISLEPVTSLVPTSSESTALLDDPDSPTTAAFAPLFSEIFGPSWRCPSPVVLHIGSPDSATPSADLCPIWKKSNDIFNKVFQPRPGAANLLNSSPFEAGYLYLGIKQGWTSFNEWLQSPALRILKEVDEFLFCHLPRVERLAVAYKSFKLLKYYLNATKDELEKVPAWLQPSIHQSRTKHPIAIDFFAWPTLRDRLISTHDEIFRTQNLSHCYSQYLRFDWPFSFEDTFFFDDASQAYYPSPLFERYHRDLNYWTVRNEFYGILPEMAGDIEGDRRRFGEVFS